MLYCYNNNLYIKYIKQGTVPYGIRRNKMSEATLVSTNIRITPEQREFIRGSGYSLSKLVRVTIAEIMEKK